MLSPGGVRNGRMGVWKAQQCEYILIVEMGCNTGVVW